MSFQKRLSILLDSEVKDLYGVPHYSLEEKRLHFSLNDVETHVLNAIRDRAHRCYAVVLLGYFKTKPIVLDASYGKAECDLKFVANEYYPGLKLRRFSLTQKQKHRFYLKIFNLLDYQIWNNTQHQAQILKYLEKVAKSCIEPRYVFDACIDYLAQQRIAIPKYTVLQHIVSLAVSYERNRILTILKKTTSNELVTDLANLIDGQSTLTFKELRQSAKNFNTLELEKELKMNQSIQAWMNEAHGIISSLSLSVKNQQYYASMIDYYSITKLKRFKRTTQQLYLLCYFQERAQQNIEHLIDGFIHHVRKLREQANAYAKEIVYRDWEGAATNISKAAELLH